MPESLSHSSDVAKAAQENSARRQPRWSKAIEDAARASGLPPEEIARRQALVYGQTDEQKREAKLAEIEARAAAVQRDRDAREARREREAPAMTCELDPGAPKASWAREGEAPAGSREEVRKHAHVAGIQQRKYRKREWKQSRRAKRAAAEHAALEFSRERSWTEARRQRLATIMKRNEATIAHPASARAAMERLTVWAQAAVMRALHAQRWTLADEAARRHVAWWATMLELRRVRAWLRPKQVKNKSGSHRYTGLSRYSYAVVGWTQTALAHALTGAPKTWEDADPIDVKTVQRHTALAAAHGGVRVVVRNPDAEPELRGRPTDANPKGWAINEYWIPDAEDFHKPAFTGRWFAADGRALELQDALLLELTPRCKRPRRLAEQAQAARQAAEEPPDIG